MKAVPFHPGALPLECSSGFRRIVVQKHIDKIAQARAIAVPPFVEEADINQFYGLRNNIPASLSANAPPLNVDIRLLGNTRITAAEPMAFFPNHVLSWSDALYRLVQHGWKPSEITTYINYLRDYDNSSPAAIKPDTIRERMCRADKHVFGMTWSVTNRPKFTTKFFTAENWVVAQIIYNGAWGGLVGYYPVDLAEGLKHWPTGSEERLLTCAVRHGIPNGHRYVKLSHLQNCLQNFQIGFPLLPPTAIMGVEVSILIWPARMSWEASLAGKRDGTQLVA